MAYPGWFSPFFTLCCGKLMTVKTTQGFNIRIDSLLGFC